MEIIYDNPIEVSRDQYLMVKTMFAEIVAHRQENGRYYIKLWNMHFKQHLTNFLESAKETKV